MKRCKIEVIQHVGGVTIWCAACSESVAWQLFGFTEEEVVATAKGHRKVMAAARAAARQIPTTKGNSK